MIMSSFGRLDWIMIKLKWITRKVEGILIDGANEGIFIWRGVEKD